MFFSRDDDKSGSKAPKKRSLLGQLFNPNVGTEIKPVFESGRMFVRMLAYILASYKLFPKDHPALNDTSLKLSLGDVIGTAYRRLSFTREGIPQIILFVAVFGCLIFSALFIVTLLLSLFMGSAHAADSAVTSIFQSPAPATDWGLNWINYLFSGTQIPNGDTAVPQPQNCGIQTSLGAALGIYSSAVLVLAGFLLMYHLVFMVAEQAHTGKIMGKANQIWGPIRLVFAIGMLVPITAGDATSTVDGTCSVTGYNTAQYAVVQVARWGSGLASNIWSNFVTNLQQTQLPACPSDGAASSTCIQPTVDYKKVIRTLIAMDACSYFFNKYMEPYNSYAVGQVITDPDGRIVAGDTTPVAAFVIPRLSDLPFSIGSFHGNFMGITLSGEGLSVGYKAFFEKDKGRLCGGYLAPPYNTSEYDAVRNAQYQAISDIADEIGSAVTNPFASYYVQGVNDQPSEAELKTAINALVTTLRSETQSRTAEALSSADTLVQTNFKKDLTDSTSLTSGGWLTAGAWFTQIIRVQSARSDAVRSAQPVFVEPAIFKLAQEPREEAKEQPWYWMGAKEQSGAYGSLKSTAGSLSNYMNAVDSAMNALDSSVDGASATSTGGVNLDEERTRMSLTNSNNPLNVFLAKIDELMAENMTWYNGAIGLRFGVTSNPLAEIAAFGQSNVSTALSIMAYSSIASIFTAYVPMAGLVIGFMFALASTIFAIGFTLGYIVPLYPFYRFFFGSITWIMTVMEAVVLAPIFALAHIEPQGEGLAGKNARYGYSVLMQLILRPVLMVFGLVVGHLLFIVAVAFLNDAFVYAVRGTGALGADLPTIGKIIYTAIYATLVVILANQCFSTIGLFPQVALKWLNMQGVQEERTSDPGMLTGVATAAAGHISSKVGAPGQAVGKYVSERHNQKLADAEKAQTKAVGTSRHDEMMEALRGGAAAKHSQIMPPSSDFGAGGGPHGGGAVAVQGGAADDYGSATSGNATQMPPDSIPGANYTSDSPYAGTPGVSSPNQQSDFKANIPPEKPKPDPKLEKQQEQWIAKTDGGKKTPDDWNSGA